MFDICNSNDLYKHVFIESLPIRTETFHTEVSGTIDDQHFYQSEIFQSLLKRFIKLMHKEKVFTNPHISQMLIAKELNTNRVYVSRLVNGVFKMTYSNYISYCRIWEFVRLANYDLTASFRSEYLAIQSGFSRRASFYEAFKKKMGITPAKWIKNGKPDLRHLFPPTIKMFIE